MHMAYSSKWFLYYVIFSVPLSLYFCVFFLFFNFPFLLHFLLVFALLFAAAPNNTIWLTIFSHLFSFFSSLAKLFTLVGVSWLVR